jgi:hypothetical protein
MVMQEFQIKATFDDQVSAEVAGVQKAFENMGGAAGAVTDEITSRVDNAISTMVEFGATGQQVEKGFQLLNKAAKTTGTSVAQASNVLRTLVDETEDADKALANVSKGMALAASTGMKFEDAGRELGKALKGDVAVLNQFDARAKAAAARLEGITDPALRAKLVMQQLNKAMARQNSILAKVSNGFKGFAATQPGITKLFKAFGLSVAGASAALIGFSTKAVGSYLAGSAKMRKATAKGKKTIEDLTFQIGGLITKALGIDKALTSGGKGLDNFKKVFDKNRLALAKGIRAVGQVAFKVGKAITFVVGGLVQGVALAIDLVNGFVKKVQAPVGAMFEFISGLMSDINFLATELGFSAPFTAKVIGDVLATAKSLRREAEGDVSFALTEAAVEGVKAMDALIDSFEDALGLQDKLTKADVSRQAIGKKTKAGAAGKKKQADALPLLMAAGDAGLGAGDVIGSLAHEEFAGPAEALIPAEARAGDAFAGLSGDIDLAVNSMDLFNSKAVDATGILQDLRSGGMDFLSDGISGMAEAFVAGGDAMSAFGRGLIEQLADLSISAGKAFVLLGAGVDAIEAGTLGGGTAVAIGVGLLALGGALKGFASSMGGGGGGGDGGQTAAALDRFGRRLFETADTGEGRTVNISIDGRQMRGYVLDTMQDGVSRSQVPALISRGGR